MACASGLVGPVSDWDADAYREARTEDRDLALFMADQRLAELEADNEALRAGNDKLGPWMSAALEDEAVCGEMKADIRAWFVSTVDRDSPPRAGQTVEVLAFGRPGWSEKDD